MGRGSVRGIGVVNDDGDGDARNVRFPFVEITAIDDNHQRVPRVLDSTAPARSIKFLCARWLERKQARRPFPHMTKYRLHAKE
jgi:hypothetical protein